MTPRLERAGLHLLRDREKRERQIDDDAAERDVRRDAVLIGVRSDDVCVLLLARGLKDAEPGGVSILENHVDALRELRERLLLAGADVVPVADVRRDNGDGGVRPRVRPARTRGSFRRRAEAPGRR